MKVETEKSQGISADSALEVARHIDTLLSQPFTNEQLLPPEDLGNTFKKAQRLYEELKPRFIKRSPGYKKRLESYELVDKILPGASLIHAKIRDDDDIADGDADNNNHDNTNSDIPKNQTDMVNYFKAVADGYGGFTPGNDRAVRMMPLFDVGFSLWGTSPEDVEEARRLALLSLETIMVDAVRADGKLLSKGGLDEYHRWNTGPTQSMYAKAAKVDWRPVKASERMDTTFREGKENYGFDERMALSQARIQSFRIKDIHDDLERGIVNIDEQTLSYAGLEAGSNPQDVIDHPFIREHVLELADEAGRDFRTAASRSLKFALTNPRGFVAINGMLYNFNGIRKKVRTEYGYESVVNRIWHRMGSYASTRL